MTIAIVYATFADADEATRIGYAMMEARLAACVNIMPPCRSIYRWGDAIESAEETPAVFKTRADLADALVAAITQAHGYETPAVTAWTATAAADYAAWIATETAVVS